MARSDNMASRIVVAQIVDVEAMTVSLAGLHIDSVTEKTISGLTANALIANIAIAVTVDRDCRGVPD